MDSVHSTYRQVVLDSHICSGTKLRKLHFHKCLKIDLIAELLPHNQLESLRFLDCSFTPTLADELELIERVPAEVMADCSNQFLPKLEKFEIFGSSCMGQWWRLFECYRPLLTDLKVICFHFDLPIASQYNWSDAPNLWPKL